MHPFGRFTAFARRFATPPSPTLAMISVDIRRDLIDPLKQLSHYRLVHLHQRAPYGDLVTDDLDESLEQYQSAPELFWRLVRNNPTIIQASEPFAIRQLPLLYAAFIYALFWRKPMFASVHISRPLQDKYGKLVAHALRLLAQPYLRKISLFFYLNDGGKRNLSWSGVPERKMMRHMYGTWGIDPDEFTSEPDSSEPDWSDAPTLLYVGRIHEEKGVFDLLEAAQLLPETVRLVFIGDGPSRAEAETIASKNRMEKRVLFLGALPNRHLPAYFRAADIFVSPARTTKKWEEYVGMTNIQAMGCGTPIISTKSGAIPEYVPDGKAGFLVDERNPKQLAAAIQRLLDNPDLRIEMGCFGRKHAVAYYDSRKNLAQAEAILREKYG